MNQALAGDILEYLIEPSGECDRPKLFTILNRIRERMYQMYAELPMFEISQCFEIQTFCADCNTCGERYRGVTLPRDFQTVEALWYNDDPIPLYTSWREWQRGMAPECSCGLSKFDMPGLYSSERDLLPAHPRRLSVHAELTADIGKKATIRGLDAFGAARVEVITLSTEPQFTTNAMKSIERGRGFSKERTAGGVILGEEGGRVLSIYSPDETMPGYKRIKIAGLRDACNQVNIRASRRFFPVYREDDVVETENRTAFEEMARFLRLNDKQTKSPDDMRSASAAMAQAVQALKGDRAREIGKSTRGSVEVAMYSGPRRIGSWP